MLKFINWLYYTITHRLAVVVIGKTDDIIFIRRRACIGVLPDFSHNGILSVNANEAVALTLCKLHDVVRLGHDDIAFVVGHAFVVAAFGQERPAFSAAVVLLPAGAIAQWREQFLAGGQAAVKSRPADEREDELGRLRAKVGELTMENELLRERARRAEGDGGPFGRRRSR